MSIVETPKSVRPMDDFTLRWIGYGLVALGTALPIFILFVGQVAAQALTLVAVVVQLGLLLLIERMPEVFEVTTRNSSQKVINFVLVIPVAALAVAGSNFHFVRPEVAWLVAGASAALGLLVALWMPRRVKVDIPIVFGLFVGCYAAGLGWGAMTLVNRVYDTAPWQVFQPIVQSKSMSWGGRGGPHYYLVLGPWGPVDHTTNVGVNGRAYYQAQAGGSMCVVLHPGALGVAWYQVGTC
jgi:hypothetical protein